MKVQISSLIDRQDYEAWKASGLKMGHVIKLGLKAAAQAPGYIERIRELEAGNLKLQARLTSAFRRLTELEELSKDVDTHTNGGA